jgi:hypothetical protein
MRFLQVVLLTMAIWLASSDGIASASNTEIASPDSARKLLSFEDVKPNTPSKSRKPGELPRVEEERSGVPAAIGGAAAQSVSRSNNEGDTKHVTVTTYNNNGLWQKLQRWWIRTTGGKESTSTKPRRLRERA